MTTAERAQRAVSTIGDHVAALVEEHWVDIERSWSRVEGEHPRMKVGLSVTLEGALDAPRITTRLTYGTRVTDEASAQLDDPAQMKLPLEEEE